MKRLFAAALVMIAVLLASCGEAGRMAVSETVPATTPMPSTGLTDEFRRFLGIRQSRPQPLRKEEADGYTYTLESGVLRVCDGAGALLWQSEDGWYVEDFRLGDVDDDGHTDLLFSLWKSYSFGPYHPARMENDDPAVRCHLFLYTMRSGRMKRLWGSSNLPRPVYSFELSLDGEKNPVASGAVLRTVEGQYTDDFSQTDTEEFVYAWRGWGFVPE